ncbi:MAG: hypothetical protein LUQ33_02510 [Methanoregulaceae archaeon]|jgi:hypothetical protein|nr:hypothetical protein [Methanoregulaceae archaeon]
MTRPDPTSLACGIMQEFARMTGLDPPSPSPRRYLWTDAFAVCNYLELYHRTNNAAYKELAVRLVNQVHDVLGRHRADDPRKGWISGLSDKEGKLHPTIGGLRIGKKLNERKLGEPFDERLEWDQDGQYFHYLTKWMHTLNRVNRVTRDPVYIRWAVDLAKTAHARFTYVPAAGGTKKMVWKMSIDLSYPLVPSMGMHDPLDGLVTYCELQMTADTIPEPLPALRDEIADMTDICRGQNWLTDDPLGIGGLLFDASRIAQLMVQGGFDHPDLLESVEESALQGMRMVRRSRFLQLPAGYRLAFRELGLSIGIKGLEGLSGMIEGNPAVFGPKDSLHRKVAELREYMPLAEEIEQFWLDEENCRAGTWTEHREINMVMLVTSLVPDGFLMI